MVVPETQGRQGPFGAYRTITQEEAKSQMWRGIPYERQKEIIPVEWFDAWWAAAIGPDPVGAAQNPTVVRVPNGVMEDLQKYWMSGKRYYDPAKIVVPTLVIFGEWDVDTPSSMAIDVFVGLKRAPKKRLVIIGEGTHWILMEKNRLQLFQETQLFLESRSDRKEGKSVPYPFKCRR